ncbi:DNA-methyltransferase [Luteolibacter sp. AS25]|uniref:DNA-methyltransferase n=1 Tax=Luteolibacter sp. AS25 TaxID=3135776 RepID=UPI00398BAACC
MRSNQSTSAGFRFHTGDCVKGMAKYVPDASVDVVVTSPPYNLGIKYSKYDDKLAADEYLEWTKKWAGEVRRCLKPGGSFFLNVAGSLKEPMLPYSVINLLVGEGIFKLQNTIHWIKSIAMPTDEGSEKQRGHYKPINSQRFLNDCYEPVFHLTLEGTTKLDRLAIGVPYADKSNIARWGHTDGKDVKCRGNTWFIPYKTITRRAKDRPHPATFPTALAEQCMKLHGIRKDLVVMDPFLGIGHSAMAAARCGVGRFIGFDIDSEYLKVAVEEMESAEWAVSLS